MFCRSRFDNFGCSKPAYTGPKQMHSSCVHLLSSVFNRPFQICNLLQNGNLVIWDMSKKNVKRAAVGDDRCTCARAEGKRKRIICCHCKFISYMFLQPRAVCESKSPPHWKRTHMHHRAHGCIACRARLRKSSSKIESSTYQKKLDFILECVGLRWDSSISLVILQNAPSTSFSHTSSIFRKSIIGKQCFNINDHQSDTNHPSKMEN